MLIGSKSILVLDNEQVGVATGVEDQVEVNTSITYKFSTNPNEDASFTITRVLMGAVGIG